MNAKQTPSRHQHTVQMQASKSQMKAGENFDYVEHSRQL